MSENTIDPLVMLFSADWFLRHWSTIGVRTNPKAQAKFQQDCKAIVKQIVGTAETYWLASFEPARLTNTRRLFLLSAEAALQDPRSMTALDSLMSLPDSLEEDEVRQGEIASVNDRLMAGRSSHLLPHLNDNLRNQVTQVWQRYRPPRADLENSATSSPTQWDTYLRSLTPDLPSRLSDYLSKLLGRSTDVRSFWQDLTEKMPPQKRDDLLEWYRAAIKQTLGEEFVPPSWMTLHRNTNDKE